MSTERLADRTEGLDDDPRAAGSRAAGLVLDLDDAGPGPRDAAPRPPPDWPAVRHAGAVVLVLLAVLVAASAQPRGLPTPDDLRVRLAAAPALPTAVRTAPLGATTVRVLVLNTGVRRMQVSGVRLAYVGSPPTAALMRSAHVDPDARVAVPVRVLPDCRALPSDPGEDLVVQLTVRGPGGARTLQLPAQPVGVPLGNVCPPRRPGMHVVMTGHRPTSDGDGVELRLVNIGRLPARVVVPDDVRSVRTRPGFPLTLQPGESQVVRTSWLAACPAARRFDVPRLEARGRFGWEAVKDTSGAVIGTDSAVDRRC